MSTAIQFAGFRLQVLCERGDTYDIQIDARFEEDDVTAYGQITDCNGQLRFDDVTFENAHSFDVLKGFIDQLASISNGAFRNLIHTYTLNLVS